MPEPVPDAELMRSLGRLVRGLSALFWGLPIAFLACYYTAKAEALRSFGVLPPLVCTGLLVYGLGQLSAFQRQERVWRVALDRAQVLALLNFGFSPFLYWWNRMPANVFFYGVVLLMALTSLLFLGSLNVVLQRLGAMLPDEALRLETRQFTSLNLKLLSAIFLLGTAMLVADNLQDPPLYLQALAAELSRASFWFQGFLVLLVLLPLAMTMALLWKTKEIILESVFSAKR